MGIAVQGLEVHGGDINLLQGKVALPGLSEEGRRLLHHRPLTLDGKAQSSLFLLQWADSAQILFKKAAYSFLC